MRLILLAVLAQAVALPEAPAAQPPVAEASPAVPLLPALTMLKLEMVDGVSTRTTKRGDRFAIRLAEAIDLSLPAGTTGHGEVVHAQKAGAAGRAGELILAARCLEVKGVCLKLRSLKVAPPHATERSDLALAVGVAAGPVGFLISGGHRDVAAGTAFTALTAENTPWPPQPVAP